MKVSIHQSQREWIIHVEGRLDTESAERFRNEIKSIDFANAERIVLDFQELSYLSSAGLREMLVLKKKLKDTAEVNVIHANEAVTAVFEVTGFDSFINVSGKNDNGFDYRHASFKEALAYKLKQHPDKVFVNFLRDYSWLDIEKASQIIAMDLHRLGVRKGSHVAICSANSVNWIFTFFAIQKLGALAVLINNGLKEEGIVQLSNLGDITHICLGDLSGTTDYEGLAQAITENENSQILKVYDMRSQVDFTKRFPEYEDVYGLFEQKVGYDDPAVMIFSSGSTGTPKGVLLSPYNVFTATELALDRAPASVLVRTCIVLPLFHIFAFISSFLVPLYLDSILYIPQDIRTDTILQVLSDHKCTFICSVPTMILAIANNKGFRPERVDSLQFCLVGGAAIPEAHLAMLNKLFKNTHFSIIYALSEYAPVSISKMEDDFYHVANTVGVPCTGIEIQIAANGEILLKGDTLMTGYYKTDMGSQAVDSDGWLHTGDLGYMDEEGYLHLSGRIKDIIIRGGENILPKEVASAISAYEPIADVMVMGIPDSFFGEIVAAAVTIKNGYGYDEKQLKDFLSNKLEKQKIPAHIAVYDAFPMLPNGKVDFVSLKKDMNASYRNVSAASSPRT